MLLRSIRAHLLTSCATLLLAFVVSAGAVGVAGAARVGHTPGAVAAMLALYGAVALAEQLRALDRNGQDVIVDAGSDYKSKAPEAKPGKSAKVSLEATDDIPF